MTASVAYRTAASGAHLVQPWLLRSWRRSIQLGARDVSADAAARSCLVVAPHPDDETLGCGALIARKRAAGTPVTVVIVADGRHAQHRSRQVSATMLAELRSAEAIAACAALGVDERDVHQLGIEDLTVAHRVGEVASRLRSLHDRLRPEEVLVVSGLDHHPDHRAVNAAALRVMASLDDPPRVREFPVWSWIDGPWRDLGARPPWARAVHLATEPLRALAAGRAERVSTAGHLEQKRAALAAHATQTTAFTDEEEWAVMDDRMLEPFLGEYEILLPAGSVGR